MSAPHTEWERKLEKLLSVMAPGQRYSLAELSLATGLSALNVNRVLARAANIGIVVKGKAGQHLRYSRPLTEEPNSSPATTSAPQLTGYDREMRQFAELCMLVRPPVESKKTAGPLPGKPGRRRRPRST